MDRGAWELLKKKSPLPLLSRGNVETKRPRRSRPDGRRNVKLNLQKKQGVENCALFPKAPLDRNRKEKGGGELAGKAPKERSGVIDLLGRGGQPAENLGPPIQAHWGLEEKKNQGLKRGEAGEHYWRTMKGGTEDSDNQEKSHHVQGIERG